MLIKLLKPMACAQYQGHEGDVIDVDDALAEELVDTNQAVPHFGKPPILHPGEDTAEAKQITTDPATAVKAEDVTDQHDSPVPIGNDAGSQEAALDNANMHIEEAEDGKSQVVKAENPNG